MDDYKMDYQGRIGLCREKFAANMATMYAPHVALRNNPEGTALYLAEICEAINSKLPSELNHDQYVQALRDIWRGCIAEHKSRYWFDLALCIKQANKLASRMGKTGAGGERYITKQEQAELDSKARDKQNLNWTLAGAEKALADTERMIATGELPAGIGNILAQIPRAEIERRRARESSDAIPTLDDL